MLNSQFGTNDMMTNVTRFAVVPSQPVNMVVSYLKPLPKPSNHQQIVTLPFTLASYKSLDEQLWTDNDGDRHRWKRCQHYKCYTDISARDGSGLFPWYTPSFQTSPNQPHYSGPGNPQLITGVSAFTSAFGSWGSHVLHADIPQLRVAQPDGGFLPSPSSIDSLIEASLRSMLPTIKAELSLINSVIELKDFRSLPTTLSNIGNFSKKLVNLAAGLASKPFRSRLFGRFLKVRNSFGTTDPTLREALHTGADGYLSKEFAIEPLLSDMCSIYTALSRVEKRLNDLLVRQGRRQIKHFTFGWQELPGVNNKLASYLVNSGQFTGTLSVPGFQSVYKQHSHKFDVTRIVSYEPTIFHAEIEYNYHFTRFQLEHAQVLALLDSLGINLNPAIIWNAIPWTFLVDWFINVSRWLNNRSTLNMEPVTNISRYLWSWKRHRLIRFSVKSTANLHGLPLIDSYLPDTHEIAYKREIGIPETNSLIVSGLSAKELSLGVALAITQARRQNIRAR